MLDRWRQLAHTKLAEGNGVDLGVGGKAVDGPGSSNERRRDGMGGWMDWVSGGSGGRAMDGCWPGRWLRRRRGIFSLSETACSVRCGFLSRAARAMTW